jgi:hypothetical protein
MFKIFNESANIKINLFCPHPDLPPNGGRRWNQLISRQFKVPPFGGI